MALPASAVMERGDYPWETELRSHHDKEMADELGKVKWLLNLGPTGIRARIYPNKPDQLGVKYVFQDAKSPAKGLVAIEDVIAGAHGKRFKTSHRFGRNLPGGGGWDGRFGWWCRWLRCRWLSRRCGLNQGWGWRYRRSGLCAGSRK